MSDFVTYDDYRGVSSNEATIHFYGDQTDTCGRPHNRLQGWLFSSMCVATATLSGLAAASESASEATSNVVVFADSPRLFRDALPMPRVCDQVEYILRTFSLNVTQAARVLGVTRPTVYSWRKTAGYGKVEDTNQDRLLLVFKLAQSWLERGLGPLGEKALIPFRDDGMCLVDYLSADVLDESAISRILERFDLIAAQVVQRGSAVLDSDKWREAFRELGFEDSSPEQQTANLEDNIRRMRYQY